ncbi:hypothetical protein GGS24DRAFT_227360 [Hypoxylon argillaceum]|nr:hypothetical protein GGS24DRAFT_227360 [Hypoxylon argillaceum]
MVTNAFSIDKDHQVKTWLQSLDKDLDDQVKTWPLSLDAAEEPAAKRPRLRPRAYFENDTFANQYNLLSSPPITMSGASSRKRGADKLDSPASYPPPLPPNVPIRQPRSPNKRQRSNSPTKPKPKAALHLLEKPIHVKNLRDNRYLLPKDVESLYYDLERTGHMEGVIPCEVRTSVLDMVGPGEARSFCFRENPTPGAEALHATLCEIRWEASAAEKDEYHETGWNHLVHSPLLKLVFSSRTLSDIASQVRAKDDAQPNAQPETQAQPQTSANVRVVPAMSATIYGEYISAMAEKTAAAWDASAVVASSSEAGFTSLEDLEGVSGTDLYRQAYNRSDGKKVDYVLAIDPPDNSPLQRVISFYVDNEAIARNLYPHVNQTIYQTLRHSPIACSIETKVQYQAQDPLLQLGTWIAAWHKRMFYLRRYILLESGLSVSRDRDRDLLPSTLLIVVANHEWRLFFACDRYNSMELYGPLNIGSTENIARLYALFASLNTIKAWIETTFSKGIGQWLMCDQLCK